MLENTVNDSSYSATEVSMHIKAMPRFCLSDYAKGLALFIYEHGAR